MSSSIDKNRFHFRSYSSKSKSYTNSNNIIIRPNVTAPSLCCRKNLKFSYRQILENLRVLSVVSGNKCKEIPNSPKKKHKIGPLTYKTSNRPSKNWISTVFWEMLSYDGSSILGWDSKSSHKSRRTVKNIYSRGNLSRQPIGPNKRLDSTISVT